MSTIRFPKEWERERLGVEGNAVVLDIEYNDYYKLLDDIGKADGQDELLPCHLSKLSEDDRRDFLEEIYTNFVGALIKHGILIMLPKG